MCGVGDIYGFLVAEDIEVGGLSEILWSKSAEKGKTVEMSETYKKRQRFTFSDDIAWLQERREALQKLMPSGLWPLRANEMDKVLNAIRRIDVVLFHALEEATEELRQQQP